ncbi:MAG TPA: hypothetical protein PLA27_17610 [Anaerolineales bacterium]|nr:hypothetical protein [Anaerolineales bacterium]HQX18239.1 hypothetical protein [Anaerolineales bacterium]
MFSAILVDLFTLAKSVSPSLPALLWQSAGVLIGQVVIAVGLLMMIPYKVQAGET